MTDKRSNLITVGRITGVFGIKGWLKVKSFTSPESNILNYAPWWLKTRHGVKKIEIDSHSLRANGLVVHIKGVDDRDVAADYSATDIAIERDLLPDLDAGDFYWSQLIGLRVVSEYQGNVYDFGIVEQLLETGANDVLVIKADDQSIDQRERLVPYVLDTYVTSVNLDTGEIRVAWDPEF
ncbi:ribosome maturation factor RimM [Teredinibacter waterburyi]|uniref:ribosome maturation factor RimM n=1 Tax=Teredinibacter waterburyi TaxID=1500538 RepID=UPI00165FCBCB|nr:ribosome maturation factor RimM [Teredinibacter waterburyi]